jgi:hypothetical protein
LYILADNEAQWSSIYVEGIDKSVPNNAVDEWPSVGHLVGSAPATPDCASITAAEPVPFRSPGRCRRRPRCAGPRKVEIDRLELVLRQISEVEAERDEMLRPAKASSPAALLMRLKGIGAEFATVLYLEGLFRHFENRRQLAAYTGLARSPWKSGSIDQEQGISKAGNPRLRTTMVELAWMWVRVRDRESPANRTPQRYRARRHSFGPSRVSAGE